MQAGRIWRTGEKAFYDQREVDVLEGLALPKGLPKVTQVDNDAEFTLKAFDERDQRQHQASVQMQGQADGQPVYPEFNGRSRNVLICFGLHPLKPHSR